MTRFIARVCTPILLVRALFAYLDPGSGSLIVQLIVAAIVGILATLRFWKARLLRLFGIRSDAIEDEEIELRDEDASRSA